MGRKEPFGKIGLNRVATSLMAEAAAAAADSRAWLGAVKDLFFQSKDLPANRDRPFHGSSCRC